MSFSIPAIGWLVLPLTALLVLLRRDLLLPWAVFLSFFQAASALNFVRHGVPYGLQPGMLAAGVCCIVWLAFRPHRQSMPGSRFLHWVWIGFLLFAAYALFSSYFIPHELAGAIMVDSPRIGLGTVGMVPLGFSSTNVSQDFYVILIGGFFIIAGWAVYASQNRSLWRNTLNALLLGGIVSSLIGMYRVAASYTGLYFPASFFNSNPGYDQNFGQQIGGLSRLSATFTEPSMAGFFLGASAACAVWLVLFGHRSWLAWSALVLSLTALVLTTSTTAYLGVFVIALGAGLRVMFRSSISPRTLATLLVLLLLAAVGIIGLQRQASSDVSMVWTNSVVKKAETESFRDRRASNLNALAILRETAGAGAGWGSSRNSSMVLSLLANAGLPGCAGLLLCASLIFLLFRRSRALLPEQTRVEMESLAFAVLVMLATGAAAMPDAMQVPLWASLAMVAGLGARAWTVANARRRKGRTSRVAVPAPPAILLG